MTTHNTPLTILSTAIRQDAEGRYCLNDCHKASGGDPRNRPGEWLRNDQTQALVAELTDAENPASPVSSVKGGLNQGTYGSEEVVLAYAQWISPAFHVQCLRALLALMKGDIPSARPKRIRKLAIDTVFVRYHRIASLRPNADPNQCWIAAGRATYEKCGENPCETLGIVSMEAPDQTNHKTVTEIGKMIGMSGQAVNKALIAMSYQVKVEGASSTSSPYEMLDRGKPYGRMYDESRKRGKGAQQVLKWSPDIAEQIKRHTDVNKAAELALAGKLVEQDIRAPFAKKREAEAV